jgi:prepilin-type processing-associated H-X9-DG protein
MSLDAQAPDFSPRKPEPSSTSYLPWLIAGGVVLAVLALVLLTSHKKAVPPGTLLPLDPNASALVFSQPELSESSSLSGANVTYLDGHVRNVGTKTITGAELQVVFANDVQMPPQVQAVPLSVIRTHEPYIDTQALSAAPLAPGEEREFRLPFEDVSENWNQQMPVIRVTHLEAH